MQVSFPMPLRDALVDTRGRLVQSWTRWMLQLSGSLDQAPRVIRVIRHEAATAGFVIAPLVTVQEAGMYRVSIYATGATVGLVVEHTAGGTSWSQNLPASYPLTGTVFVKVDANTTMNYGLSAGTEGPFDAVVVVERVSIW